MATFDLPAQAGADRDAAILSHATKGDLELSWVPLTVGRVQLLVTPDAVKLAGVRINVSANVQQQLADYFGALLFTPKVADLHYAARAVTIPPQTMAITSSTAGMQTESQRIDAAIAKAGGTDGIVGTVGKHWVIDNALLQHAGMAENYGWHLPRGTKSPWQGVGIYPSVTMTAMVIQQPSWTHDPSHTDYSQQACFMHRDCTVDGKREDLATVLQDATLGPLFGGPLKVLRQPGVPLYACAVSAPHMIVSAAIPGSLCPTPAAPIVTPTTGWFGRNWGWVLVGAGVATAIGGAWYAESSK